MSILKTRPLLLLSAAASLVFLLTSPYAPANRTVVFKVASIALLAVLGFRVNKLLGVALTFGALGDFLLGIHQLGSLDAEKLFLFGLVSFLAGHLVYIVLFRRMPRRLTSLGAIGILIVIVAIAFMLSQLYSSLGPLLLPVILYAVVLAAMAISAQLADIGNSLPAIGALSFVASDAMLAIGKFRSPFAGSGPLIWITYYAAQLLIFLGVARRSRGMP